MNVLNIIKCRDIENKLKAQKIKKIYNNGKIIISYQGSSNEIYQVNKKSNKNKDIFYKIHNKSKSIGSKSNISNKNNKYKTIKKQVEEMYNQIQKEIDEMNSDEESKRNIGYILKDFFTEEELSDKKTFSPNPIININDSINNSLNENNNNKKIKLYIPEIQPNKQKEIANNVQENCDKNKSNPLINIITKENKNIKPNEVNLQKIIDICKDNEKIINKINELYIRFIRDEKAREEKKRKKQILKEIKRSKSKEKEIKDKIKKINEQFEKIIIINDKNIYNENEIKEAKEEKEEEKEEEKGVNTTVKSIINSNNKICKKDLIKIIDISKDQKYVEAKKQIKRSKENFEKTNDLIMEINHKIREDKKSIGHSDFKAKKQPRKDVENKAKQIIEQVKLNINFTYDNPNKDN